MNELALMAHEAHKLPSNGHRRKMRKSLESPIDSKLFHV